MLFLFPLKLGPAPFQKSGPRKGRKCARDIVSFLFVLLFCIGTMYKQIKHAIKMFPTTDLPLISFRRIRRNRRAIARLER